MSVRVQAGMPHIDPNAEPNLDLINDPEWHVLREFAINTPHPGYGADEDAIAVFAEARRKVSGAASAWAAFIKLHGVFDAKSRTSWRDGNIKVIQVWVRLLPTDQG